LSGDPIQPESIYILDKASSLQHNTRCEDTITCWGDEEFPVLLARVAREGLVNIAKKLRTLVENPHRTLNSKKIAVTISIGTTLAYPEDNLDSFLNRANQDIYRNKFARRNYMSTD
jgi:diguanylate cyclase (GGDEF)-like protein